MGSRGNPGHSPEYRQWAVEKTIENGNIARTCREIQLARSVLSRWVRAYRQAGGKGLELSPGRPRGAKNGSGRRRAGAGRKAGTEDLDLLRRKIGEQQVMIDFLSEACKRVGAPTAPSSGRGGKGSTPRSPR